MSRAETARMTIARRFPTLSRWGAMLAFMAVGATLSLLAFNFSRRLDDRRVANALELRVEWRAQDFQRKIASAADDIQSLANYFATQGDVDAKNFARFADLGHSSTDPIHSLFWAPLVTAADRTTFLTSAHEAGSSIPDITQVMPDGRFTTAGDRASYMPIEYEANFGNEPGPPGFDMLAAPLRRAVILSARDHGVPMATPPANIFTLSGHKLEGYLVFWPVYTTGTVPAMDERRAAFRGTVIGRFAFEQLLPALIAGTPKIDESIDLFVGSDANASGAAPIAHYDPGRTTFTVGAGDKNPRPDRFTFTRQFDIFGQQWTLVSHFAPATVDSLRSAGPWAWLVVGLLLTGALAFSTIELSRRRDTRVIQQSEMRLRAVMDHTIDGLITIRADGMVTTFSHPAERIFGYSASEVIGQNAAILLADPPIGGRRNDVAAYLHTGDAQSIAEGGEIVGRRKDGSTFPMDLAIGELPVHDGTREFIATVRDITERTAIETEIRRSQALLQATFDASPFSIVIKNNAFKTLFWNRAAEQISGDTTEDTQTGEPFREPRFHELALQSVLSGPIRGIEEERRRKDGSTLRLRGTIAPIRVDGKLTGFVGMFEDVTNSTAIERQLVQAQKMEAIGNLSGGMAHDFNNLLGIIIGNLDLQLRELPADSEAAELARESLDASLRGADLTRRLLAFARQQSLQPRLVDLNALVKEITRLLRRTLGERVDIALGIAPDLWSAIVDPVQLQASITNLATNARDAMPKGGRLSIVTANRRLDADYAEQHADVAPGDYAMIEVSDSGIGIPPEILGKIFEPFFTTRDREQGTGLGLSMVFGFIKQSGGHISVYSEPSAGTTFRLYLPRAAETAKPTTLTDRAVPPPGGNETILAVEDNTVLRRVVVRQLTAFGYRVLEADSAAAALTILEGESVDLLFTDVVMPGDIDGFALAEAVHARWPATKIILTSGFPEARYSRDPAQTQSIHILSKPYRRDDLARALRDALDA